MDKYQLEEILGEDPHAGTKAHKDVRIIAQAMGFAPLYIKQTSSQADIMHKLTRKIHFFMDWTSVYRQISHGAIVILQHPFYCAQYARERTLLKLKNKKKVRFISVVHDVEELRTLVKNKRHHAEFEFMLNLADVLIVHNDAMREFFISKGIEKDRIVTLGIFDYLWNELNYKSPVFSKEIIVAGNLDVAKSGYIACLPDLKCKFQLYGINYSLQESDNINYGGVLKPEHVPEVLTGGFGLVWDGDSAESCTGGCGDYLRYNNPHKLSLYLASGIPVIIWKNAAEAKFVEENSVGFSVDSLYDIPQLMENLSANEYKKLSENVANISVKLIHGMYMKEALENALTILEQNDYFRE